VIVISSPVYHFHAPIASPNDRAAGIHYGGSTLVTLPRTVMPYRDSVDGTCDYVTYRKLVTRSRYELVRCAVGIWPSHQRDDMVTA